MYSVALLLILITALPPCHSFKQLANVKRSSSILRLKLKDLPDHQNIFIEITSVKKLENAEASVQAYEAVYEDDKPNGIQEKVADALDSRMLSDIGLFVNPLTICLGLYVSGLCQVGMSRVTWFQKILKIFGKGTLVTKDKETGKIRDITEEDLEPFEVYECEKCKMELRPARGRGQVILERPRFRCSRCGSKASFYFNIENMEDPRAVARLERLKKEEKDREDADDAEFGVEDEPPTPQTKM